MKTAVESLVAELYMFSDIPESVKIKIEQAKQMERGQIEDAFEYGWSARNADSMKYGKQYYNETFNKWKQQ